MATSISDIPFGENKDDLQINNYVKGLIKFISNAQAPLTIALQGEWGSGKTSLMNRLRRELCDNNSSEFLGVSINTWEYSMLATPDQTVYNILARLVKEIGKNSSGVKKNLKRFGNMLYRGGRELLKGAKIAGSSLPIIGIAMEALNVPTENPFSSEDDEIALSELRESLEEAVKQLIKSENKKGIIIFVDDLDRLNPPIAVEILELLKNVFTLDNCIFVLAIDYEVVVKGLEPKFGKLTVQNEREFRSFFDKIIQVPFSLPVNSYQPMTFVKDSLKAIGYIGENESLDTEQERLFSAVVKASVGNNPRSIKRLINTLSLLDCITRESEKNEQASRRHPENDFREKLLNFIVVAIQICYSRVYSLLVDKPNFTEWNREFAVREGIVLSAIGDEDEPGWADLLEIVCSSDNYLSRHYLDISMLFSMMMDIIAQYDGNPNENIGKKLTEILNKASVTGVRSNLHVDNFDKKAFIHKLYENIDRRIHQVRPDIDSIKRKNNTGNGGFKFRDSHGNGYDIKFVPSLNQDNSISLRLSLSTRLMRSQEMLGKTLEELLENSRLAKALSALDAALTPLLEERSFFTSIHAKDNLWFASYSDELRYHHNEGSMTGDVTHDAEYCITLPTASDFESVRIVDAIASTVIANYDFRKFLSEGE